MANTDRAMGFQVFGPLLSSHLYAIQTAPTIAFYHGDLVGHGGTSISCKFGYMPILEDAANPVALNTPSIVGAVIALFNEDMDPVKYIAAAATGDSTVAGYAMVADDPMQLYLCQEDGTGGATMAGRTGDWIYAAGSSTSGISGAELDSSTVDDRADSDLRILEPYPLDDASLANCRWVVQINAHWRGTWRDGI